MLWYGEFTWHPQTMPRRCDGASSNRTSPTLAIRKGSEAGNRRSRPLRRRTKAGQACGSGPSRALTNIDTDEAAPTPATVPPLSCPPRERNSS